MCQCDEISSMHMRSLSQSDSVIKAMQDPVRRTMHGESPWTPSQVKST